MVTSPPLPPAPAAPAAPTTGPLFGESRPRPDWDGFVVDWQLGGTELRTPASTGAGASHPGEA